MVDRRSFVRGFLWGAFLAHGLACLLLTLVSLVALFTGEWLAARNAQTFALAALAGAVLARHLAVRT